LIKKIVILCLFLCLFFVGGFFYLLDQQMSQPINLKRSTLITVKPGTSLLSFSNELVNNNWIDNRFWLRSYAKLYPEKAQIKTGTFKLNAHISLNELLNLLVIGKEHQFTITFVEGSTFKQWLEQLGKQSELTHQLSGKSIKQISQLFDINEINPEGWFFPDTYAFTEGTSDFTILKWAHIEMKNKLDTLWQKRAKNLPYKNTYQVLIMASIIEKETSVIDEMPLISSVFVNRLRKKMRLQTDPTVIYGLGDRYQGNIKRVHLREKTPYNTYRINGLPPTPIAMPGILALKAVLKPETTDFLYFVSMGNGKHIFSSNLTDHNAAVARYQLGQK
jgi:UPF0755 protein|tara:strand:- start:2920 stop:3918 length:999 start_codon:yes stop_codon:yes gene_type:complete